MEVARDGISRVEKAGVTDGISWQFEYIFNNDHLPITRWHSEYDRFMGGFLMVVAAENSFEGKVPEDGLLGMAVHFLYAAFVRSLGFEPDQIPDLDQATILSDAQAGLGDGYTVLTSNVASAENWLSTGRAQRLVEWNRVLPLQVNNAAQQPLLLVTGHGLWLVFRGQFTQPDQLDAITGLGISLLRG